MISRFTSRHTVLLIAIAGMCLLPVAAPELATRPAFGAAIPEPEVTVSVNRQTATVGDPIILILNVRYDSSLHLTPTFPGRMMGSFEVISDSVAADAISEDGPGVYERVWRLAAFRPGTYWLPSLGGELADSRGEMITWQSDSISITVKSVLTQADIDSGDIHGLKGPYVAPEPVSAWWYVLAGVILLSFVGVWLWRRRRKPDFSSGPPSIPVWETALHELQALRQEHDPESDGGRLWYFRLSEILRRYLDGRYGWQSIDQTTTEIVRRLKSAPFDGTHRDRFREFLGVADMIRYAREYAKTGRPEVDWDWVRGFVRDTMPARMTESGSGGAAGAAVDAPLPSSKTGETMAAKQDGGG